MLFFQLCWSRIGIISHTCLCKESRSLPGQRKEFVQFLQILPTSAWTHQCKHLTGESNNWCRKNGTLCSICMEFGVQHCAWEVPIWLRMEDACVAYGIWWPTTCTRNSNLCNLNESFMDVTAFKYMCYSFTWFCLNVIWSYIFSEWFVEPKPYFCIVMYEWTWQCVQYVIIMPSFSGVLLSMWTNH